MADTNYLQEYRRKLDALKRDVAELEQQIANSEVRDSLLAGAKNHLQEFEKFMEDPKNHTVGIASLALKLAEQQVDFARKLVAKYGANMKITKG